MEQQQQKCFATDEELIQDQKGYQTNLCYLRIDKTGQLANQTKIPVAWCSMGTRYDVAAEKTTHHKTPTSTAHAGTSMSRERRVQKIRRLHPATKKNYADCLEIEVEGIMRDMTCIRLVWNALACFCSGVWHVERLRAEDLIHPVNAGRGCWTPR